MTERHRDIGLSLLPPTRFTTAAKSEEGCCSTSRHICALSLRTSTFLARVAWAICTLSTFGRGRLIVGAVAPENEARPGVGSTDGRPFWKPGVMGSSGIAKRSSFSSSPPNPP